MFLSLCFFSSMFLFPRLLYIILNVYMFLVIFVIVILNPLLPNSKIYHRQEILSFKPIKKNRPTCNHVQKPHSSCVYIYCCRQFACGARKCETREIALQNDYIYIYMVRQALSYMCVCVCELRKALN